MPSLTPIIYFLYILHIYKTMLYAVVCTSNPGIGVWYYTNTIWYYSGHACICCSDISVSLPRIQIRVAGPCYPEMLHACT